MFKEMYESQQNFQIRVMNKSGIIDREKFLKDLIIHLNAETLEVLREINWKTHKDERKLVDEEALLEEMIDVIKYALSLPASWGFTEQQVTKAFFDKTKKVEERFDNG